MKLSFDTQLFLRKKLDRSCLWHMWIAIKKNLVGSRKMLVDTFCVCFMDFLLSMIKNYELLKVRKEPIWGWGHFGAGPFWDWDQFRTRANLGLGPMWDGANLGLIWGQCGMGPIWVLGQCGWGQYGPGQCGPGQYVLGQFGRIPYWLIAPIKIIF